jgi:hypothetical protein
MVIAADVELKGVFYHIAKLDVRTQQRVAWKLGGTRAGMYADMRASGNPMAEFLPLFLVLSALPPQDADFIIDTCLTVVTRKDGQSWARLLAPNGALMYDDIDVETIHRLVDQVLEFNLGGFFGTLRQDTTGPRAELQTSNGSDIPTA